VSEGRSRAVRCVPAAAALSPSSTKSTAPAHDARAPLLASRHSPTLWLGVAAFLIIAVLMSKRVKGSIMAGIVFATVVSWIPGHGASYLGPNTEIPGERTARQGGRGGGCVGARRAGGGGTGSGRRGGRVGGRASSTTPGAAPFVVPLTLRPPPHATVRAGGEARMETFRRIVSVPDASKTSLTWSFAAFGTPQLWIAVR
jgi:hypothetical protein